MVTSQPSPIILTAFSTSEQAAAACRLIESSVRNHFPGRPLYWGYNTRTIERAKKTGRSDVRLPVNILSDLATAGHPSAIVQSLHLLPGVEFHQLHHEVRRIDKIDCRLGMPLFSSQEDYTFLLDLLAPRIMADETQAVLLIGHGTRHPVWTAYLALESMLQQRFGRRVFVGVVEHFPESDQVEERIAAAGYTRVHLLPFFFSRGLHVERDMLGDGDHSWKSRLIRYGFQVEGTTDGIGMLPGIGQLVIRHIEEADCALKRCGGA